MTIIVAPNQDNEIVHCDRCGRKLKDAASRERGIGPVCERKRREGDWA